MGVPSITTNLSGFGCFMDEMIEQPADYGIYIVDRRLKSVEESVQQLADYMMQFCQKTRRQRINQRNRTERLSDLLDWKRMGLEYVKARWVAVKRKFPHYEEEDDGADDESINDAAEDEGYAAYYGVDPLLFRVPNKIPRPPSAPGSPKYVPPALHLGRFFAFCSLFFFH